MTTVAANTGGFDFGAILDKTLNAYQSISLARVNRDTAKYNMAGATQLAALHNPEAVNMLEAYGISAPNNLGASVASNANKTGINSSVVLMGGVALVGGLLLWRALK